MISKEKLIARKVAEISQSANEFPGVVIIHNVQDPNFKIEYMSPRGRQILGVSEKEISTMTSAEYFSTYFNIEDARDYVPKTIEMVQRNDMEEIYTQFQQVRSSPGAPFQWYLSSVKLLLRDTAGLPLLTISFAIPIEPKNHVTKKVSRLLEENIFFRRHTAEFASLTKREKEIARFMAKGMSSSEISKKLHITVETIKTHRKNIYQKLKIKSSYDLMDYARAFDLI
ncbi:MAG: response regulator containing a CheY-like receiver domain and an DNA-binding domain [Bacteroidetes bacterium]|jgi:DNA-binding CsgD family transcriptional regulator|nr:response regulator containing a CheY-like receiver domain and an DNA-binding domain [Bacteroidota bacterium]